MIFKANLGSVYRVCPEHPALNDEKYLRRLAFGVGVDTC